MATEDNKYKTTNLRVQVQLIPVYVTLGLQLLGVVFMSGVIWTKLDYNSANIGVMTQKLEKALSDSATDRYKGKDAERDFNKVYSNMSLLVQDIEKNRKSIELLEYRTRHFQAQFPKKNILP